MLKVLQPPIVQHMTKINGALFQIEPYNIMHILRDDSYMLFVKCVFCRKNHTYDAKESPPGQIGNWGEFTAKCSTDPYRPIPRNQNFYIVSRGATPGVGWPRPAGPRYMR